jgi:diguanylate cyclase (GGDEF)-like protein
MPLSEEKKAKEVPAEIYISLVDSLYRESPTLLIGSAAVSMAVFLTAWKVSDPWQVLCGVAMLAVAIIRSLHMRRFSSSRANLTVEVAEHWERWYVAGAATFSFLLGVWCILCFALHTDPFIRVASLAANIAYTIGTSGRNFGSSRSVAVQIACAGVPITIALLSANDGYYWAFAGLMLAFFVTLKFISDRLRKTLLSAVISESDVKRIAGRFDTALNNMPHGLAMFNADARLVVANRRLIEMLCLPADIADGRTTPRSLLMSSMRAGVILNSDVKRFTEEFDSRVSQRGLGEVSIGLHDGRTLVVTTQPMENGGSVVIVEDVTERKQAEAKIAHLARFDSLTGLPNRTFFREQMERAIALTKRGTNCAVLFIDLDQFKQVNDTLGHPAGDALLRAASDRLRRIVRDSDIVARFGGDEFVVLQSPIKGPDQAATLARRIVEAIGETYSIEGQQIVVGASVGIALAPNDGENADQLLKNADMALYRAKSNGRSGWCFFEPDMDVKAQARRSLELDLRTALLTDAFEVYYQPLINLRSMRVSTCEALIRWPHPTRGMVSPVEFIPIAEENGLIIEIGNRILRKACAECARWPEDVRVAVNLSAVQVRRGNVPDAVREALEASGLSAERLEIEITESVLLQDTDTTRLCMQELREMGVRISLDDFGTGYSSLSYLHSYPLQKVKIDRSFLDDIESNERSLTLLHGVARLSAELGLVVAIEGVETESQLALIRQEPSILEAQGFLFSRPMPKLEIRKLLRSGASFLEKVA